MINYRVTAINLNVRQGPSITAKVNDVLPGGTVVELLDVSGDQYWYKVSYKIGEQRRAVGWASHKYLQLVDPHANEREDDPPWLTIAFRELGVKEFPGVADNPRIVDYHRSTSLPAPLSSNDETHWCSSFVNWSMERAGFEGTNSAWARSWETWGLPLDIPRRGCIAVYTRPGGGHVAFYIETVGGKVKHLGGNQGDAVTIASPEREHKLLGYRWPVREP